MAITCDAASADLTQISDEALQQQITEYAGHLNAAMCRWLLLVAEFDRREAYIPSDAKNTAQWLSWRCGIDPSTAREHVRVARSLEGLPLLTKAFSEGTLSYSKVRAISRVATPAPRRIWWTWPTSPAEPRCSGSPAPSGG